MPEEIIVSEDYKNLIAEIIAKLSVILGPQIAILKAQNVPGLKLNNEGGVVEIQGKPGEVLQKLVNEYVDLSGQIIRKALEPIFKKYPAIAEIK